MEFDLVAGIFLEDIVADAQNELVEVFVFVGAGVNDHKLSDIAPVSIVIGIGHSNQLVIKMTE